MESKPRFPSTLRARILSIVILGAILPLGLTGWWLSRSATTFAESRLRAQLDSALAGADETVDARWVFRDADLKLIANNDVVVRLVANRASPLSADDTAFLSALETELRPTISSVSIRDARGRLRWAFGAASPSRDLSRGSSQPETFADPVVVVTRRIVDSSGTHVGDMAASVKLTSLIPSDSIPHVIAGSLFRIYDDVTKQQIDGSSVRANGDSGGWITVQRRLTSVPIDIELSAPTGAYLEPFERAAKWGLGMLIVVTILAIGLTALMATRLTGSLDELVKGADAVARGDLSRSVSVSGGTAEVEQLAASFNAMTDSLRSTLGKLSQRESLAAVGEFAASLSHEVRNALTAVGVDVQRAQERIDDKDKASDLLTRALLNVKRLDSIVTGALRVARTGHAPREPVDLVGVITAAVQLAEPSMASLVTTAMEDGAVQGRLVVVGDRVALEQLFLNILVNAGQAIEGAGKVDISLAVRNASVGIAIHDNGRGIDPRDLARLGEPFYSGKSKGTGLGVSIAQRIAAAHGGDLTIQSTSGGGTTVTVTLPLAPGVRDNVRLDATTRQEYASTA